jgi:hypothetical protein
MNRFVSAIIAIAFVIPAMAQESGPWGTNFFTGRKTNTPKVILHDFGTLPKGAIKKHRFEMTNIYAYTVQVKTDTQPSCRCISILEYTGKMEPNQTGHIDIQIDASRVEGPRTVTLPIKFECQDPKSGERFWSYAILEFRAVIRTEVQIEPGVVEFGAVPVGKGGSKSLVVTYNGAKRDWKIVEVGYKQDLLDVKVEEVVVKGARAAYKVNASLKRTAQAGPLDEIVVLKTNDVANPALNLTVSANIQAPLSLVPSDKIKLGNVPIGEKKTLSVIVRADKPFKITTVEGETETIKATRNPMTPLKSQVVTIEFTPTKLGAEKATMLIKTDGDESATLTVEGVGIIGEEKKTDPKP